MKKFILEKQYEGEWYYEGTYSEKTINALAQCIFWLGRNASVYDDIRVTVKEEEKIELNNYSTRK